MNQRLTLTATGDWLRAAWPVAAAVVAGVFFSDEIHHSIQATPHPALVYIILGALTFAVIAAFIVLSQLTNEERRAHRWHSVRPNEFGNFLHRIKGHTPFKDSYELVVQHAANPKEVNRQELERRLQAAEVAYAERLSLSGFIAGALVGLGLVGTFIGLLGALEDLAKLFSGMSAASGGDPAALFSGMLLKLQAPMKSMGTAFIASLYGLLGSLILGLTLVAVNNTRLRVNATVHDALFDALNHVPLPHVGTSPSGDSSVAINRLDTTLQSLTRKLDEQAAALAGLRHPQLWLDAWSQMNEQLAHLRAQEAATSQSVLAALRDQSHSVERLADVTAGMHDLMARSAARDTRADLDMQHALKECRQAFEDVTGRLRSVLALQLDHGGRFETGVVANDALAADVTAAPSLAPLAG